MPIQPSIDDTNTTLITYEGTWEELTGSTRQWEASVHSTITPGSSATFKFRGYQVWVWGTIPAGVGSNLVDFSIDGSTPNVTSRTSNGSAVYNEQYYASPLLRETYHTIVVTNRGSNANGNTEFLLDRFEFESSDTVPLFTPSGVIATPTSTPSSTATGSNGGTTSSGSKTPVGAITGAVIGALALIIIVLLYLLWRRRKGRGEDSSDTEKKSTMGRKFFPRRTTLVPTPFPLDESVSVSAPSQSTADPVPVPSEPGGGSVGLQPRTASPVMTEKAGYRNFHPESPPSSGTNNAYTDASERESPLAASTTTLGTGSNSQFPPSQPQPP
ncbi:hypothetical protein M413DRAFT_191748 [Hebeloma cylindrosporum]|uniref:Uncharacterized protein n=1 Tax=Hebeloma cylindrosporum TaxID=76867 RepID=A0A0C3C5D8_HEBCY|nr:hypothetical protein M413DRAFT_191748 [Hebeloma cylindrosporum h7]